MRYLASTLGALVVLGGFSASLAEGPDGYTLEERYHFREVLNIDNWDDGGPIMRYYFLNMHELFPQVVIHKGAGETAQLAREPRSDIGEFVTSTRAGALSLNDYVAGSTVDGLLIVHHGKLVFESYPRMRDYDRHSFQSVSKPYASTIIALLEERGEIDVSKPINDYLPTLKGSGWEGVSVQNILDMASGISCLEGEEGAYANPERCYYQFEAALGWLEATGETMADARAYMATLKSHRPAGEAFEYTSPDTFVLGWLIESITGKSYEDAVATEIWSKIGAEADGMISAPNGTPVTHGGITATLRDMARFGLLFTPSWNVVADEPVITDAYLDKIQKGGRPEIFSTAELTNAERQKVDGEMPLHNSWQWDWVMADGDFYKGGYGGNGLYISPSRDLVVAFFGTFGEDFVGHQLTHFTRQMVKAGLFDH